MSAAKWGCLVLPSFTLICLLTFHWFSFWDFSRASTQREILASYLSGAQCNDAAFDVIEHQEGLQDYLYVVRVSGSEMCLSSIKSELERLGASKSTIPLMRGYILPGHESSEFEAVAFDFGAKDGSVIWTRDKT